ncbi:hypothetical protein E4U56_001978 [Claviceps arundinis]|uniref:Uncharacterized protein n=1 Tax=Claviceps arundinis TaxID=1623583 RepID=A0A9P7N0J9_9HYPO|nr:hypothetical protein E4U56_001978 [Claviceps arundinis]
MAPADTTRNGGSTDRQIRQRDKRGMGDLPAGKYGTRDHQAWANSDVVNSRLGKRGRGSVCDIGLATRAIGATATETETQTEIATATGSATVTASVTTGSPLTDFSGQGLAGGKMAVRNAPCHPASTSLNRTRIAQPLDDYASTLNVNLTPSTTSLATASASSPSAASTGGNRIAPAVAITIGLATVAGIALIFATLLYCKVCRRLPRSGSLGSLHLQDEPEANRSLKPPLRVPSPSVIIPLADLRPSFAVPSSPALPAPLRHLDRSAPCVPVQHTPIAPSAIPSSPTGLSLSDAQGGASPWWRICGDHTVVGTGLDKNRSSIPPPRLMERKMHPSIKTPSILIPSLTTPPTSHSRGGHVRGRHTPITSNNLGPNWQEPISLITSAHLPLRTVVPGVLTSPISVPQFTTHDYRGSTSPPRTPVKPSISGPIMGLNTPGPPPNRRLPSPPPSNRYIESLSPPAKPRANNSRPEEIGVAISGPSNNTLTIDKPYYQIWCEASRWQPPPPIKPGDNHFV